MPNNSSLDFVATVPNTSFKNYGSTVRLMPDTQIITWSTVFVLEAVFIVVGNFITILTFLNYRLRQNRTFYFLINLALADFVVGAFTIPLFVYVFINFFLGEMVDSNLYTAHRVVEVFSEYLAIFSLALVALERMYAVVCPLKHRKTAFYSYILCIVFTWLLAAVVPSLAHVPLETLQTIAYYTYFIMFTTALVIICVSYMIVWSWVTCQRPNVMNRHNELDRKLARTLVLVTTVSLIAWLPFQLITYVMNLCVTCGEIPNTVVYLSKALHYGNSLVNPILYCFRIPDFYNTTLSILNITHRQDGGQVIDSMELRRQDGSEDNHLESTACIYRIPLPVNKSVESIA